MTRLEVRAERSSLRDNAYRRLREAIVTLELEPGIPITEESLADDLGVSRPIVRESLRQLEGEGLVSRLGNGRMRVSFVSVDEIHQLYAVRGALEDLTVRAAGPLLTTDDLAELDGCLGRMQDARGVEVTLAGRQFHAVLSRVAGNPVNDHLLGVLAGRIDRYRRLGVRSGSGETGRPVKSIAEHRAIFDALRDGDVDRAGTAMRVHIDNARIAVVAAVEEARRVASECDAT